TLAVSRTEPALRPSLRLPRRAMLLLCGACMLAACTTGPDEPPLTTVRPDVHVEVELAPLLSFDTPRVESEPGVLLRVEVPVRAAEDVHVRYRFLFVDGADVSLALDPAWRLQQVSPALPASLEATVVSPDVAGWRLEVRSAR
ncbi:MAG: hypothetical protein AAFX05_05485, partial [Planctomycetota bacterium]